MECPHQNRVWENGYYVCVDCGDCATVEEAGIQFDDVVPKLAQTQYSLSITPIMFWIKTTCDFWFTANKIEMPFFANRPYYNDTSNFRLNQFYSSFHSIFNERFRPFLPIGFGEIGKAAVSTFLYMVFRSMNYKSAIVATRKYIEKKITHIKIIRKIICACSTEIADFRLTYCPIQHPSTSGVVLRLLTERYERIHANFPIIHPKYIWGAIYYSLSYKLWKEWCVMNNIKNPSEFVVNIRVYRWYTQDIYNRVRGRLEGVSYYPSLAAKRFADLHYRRADYIKIPIITPADAEIIYKVCVTQLDQLGLPHALKKCEWRKEGANK